jgi:hypothetical protein
MLKILTWEVNYARSNPWRSHKRGSEIMQKEVLMISKTLP